MTPSMLVEALRIDGLSHYADQVERLGARIAALESIAKELVDDAMDVDKIYCGVKSKHVRALRDAVRGPNEQT